MARKWRKKQTKQKQSKEASFQKVGAKFWFFSFFLFLLLLLCVCHCLLMAAFDFKVTHYFVQIYFRDDTKRRISLEARHRIIVLREAGYSRNGICAQMHKKYGKKVYSGTLRKIWQKYKATGSIKDRKRSGRPKLLSEREERFLRRECLKDRQTTLTFLQKKVNIHSGKSVSREKIRRVLHKYGLGSYVPERKQLLTRRQKKKRLEWAKLHLNKSSTYWRKVLFTDESIFRTNSNRKKFGVWRFSHEKYHPRCIQTTVKHPAQIHVWGIISPYGPGLLKKVTGTLNSNTYQSNIIMTLILFASASCFLGRTFFFNKIMLIATSQGQLQRFWVLRVLIQ